jgi:hypothetical protein
MPLFIAIMFLLLVFIVAPIATCRDGLMVGKQRLKARVHEFNLSQRFHNNLRLKLPTSTSSSDLAALCLEQRTAWVDHTIKAVDFLRSGTPSSGICM